MMLLPLNICLGYGSNEALVLFDGEFDLICHAREHLQFKLEPLHFNYNHYLMEQHNSAGSVTEDGPGGGLAITKELQK